MKEIYKNETIVLPEGVDMSVKARLVTVTGPVGELKKNFKHVNVSLRVIRPSEKQAKKQTKVEIVVWHGDRKHGATLRTVRSEIENMIQGVQTGFTYKMRLVYAHFPINAIIADDKKSVEIRNFLGEKQVRHINMLEGVTISESKGVKDELILEGADIEKVSQSAFNIQGICRVRNKDIRKFLDGVYVSEKGSTGETVPVV